jgi:putative transposase
VGFSRSAAWCPLNGRDEGARLNTQSEDYSRYGYPTLHDLLRTDGLVINAKRTYRPYREEGLQVCTKRRKKLTRPRNTSGAA